MADKPILFSAPMVRAILDGRKTMTRRVLKPQPVWSDGGAIRDAAGAQEDYVEPHWISEPRPVYKVRDLLWVREAWRPNDMHPDRVIFRADVPVGAAGPWKPSIHLPRKFSRITLEVTAVKVERLQNISEEDAKAEGLDALTKDGRLIKYGIADQDGLPGTDDTGWPWDQWNADPRQAFHRLWVYINGPSSWDENPWVAAYTFRRVKP